MKKSIKIIFIITMILIILAGAKVYAVTPTLEEIANTFNNCSAVNEMAGYGAIFSATTSENKIIVSYETESEATVQFNTSIEYNLEGTILSTHIEGDDNEVMIGMLSSIMLVDSIGQLQGYEDGELYDTLNSNGIGNYTLENEGLEAKEISDHKYDIKIDISKKIPLADFSDTYVEVEDLEEFEKFISGDGFVQNSKGNIWYYKSGYNGEYEIIIAEKNGLTDNSYNSLISFLEVMFDSEDVIEYFETNYTDISEGNKEFTGCKIEIDPEDAINETAAALVDGEYQIMKVSINKEQVISIINESADEPVDNEKLDDEEEVEPVEPIESPKDINKTDEDNLDKIDSNVISSDTAIDKTTETVAKPSSTTINATEKVEKDNTTSTGKLPQTGKTETYVISIIILFVISAFLCLKNMKYKDIK